MRGSLQHASFVGLIRNLRTGYVSPQYHVIYDKIIETVIGTLENNNYVGDYIRETLAQDNGAVEHTTEQSSTEHVPIPPLYTTWLTPGEKNEQREQEMNT